MTNELAERTLDQGQSPLTFLEQELPPIPDLTDLVTAMERSRGDSQHKIGSVWIKEGLGALTQERHGDPYSIND